MSSKHSKLFKSSADDGYEMSASREPSTPITANSNESHLLSGSSLFITTSPTVSHFGKTPSTFNTSNAASPSPSPLPETLRAIAYNGSLSKDTMSNMLSHPPSKPTMVHLPPSMLPSERPTPESLGHLKWPHEFFFIDVVEGLKKYDVQMKTGKGALKQVFQGICGVPCVRETLQQKWLFLQEIEHKQEDLYEEFLSMGQECLELLSRAAAPTASRQQTNDAGPEVEELESNADEIIKDCVAEVYSSEKMTRDTTETAQCPVCHDPLPAQPSPHLKMLLELNAWYEEGYAPGSTRELEHWEILCALHYLESHSWYHFGTTYNFPTMLDKTWIRSHVRSLQEHCASVIIHASAHELFCNICEVLETKDGDLIHPTSIDCYSCKHGWLRSVGYFGEQGLETIVEALEAMFPEDDGIVQHIKPLDRHTYL
ncbi:hypothetical protein JB92DRAFT_3135596 [Gautieria morchelliformis]|nr:hypothetical protein JB92DRAFT_3135596 [Gautieria morchelliformis]